MSVDPTNETPITAELQRLGWTPSSNRSTVMRRSFRCKLPKSRIENRRQTYSAFLAGKKLLFDAEAVEQSLLQRARTNHKSA